MAALEAIGGKLDSVAPSAFNSGTAAGRFYLTPKRMPGPPPTTPFD